MWLVANAASVTLASKNGLFLILNLSPAFGKFLYFYLHI
jgi:hypothetical protein